MREIIERLCAGEALDESTVHSVFARAIAGQLSEIELSALLVALKAKGETPVEIAGAARALRQAAVPFDTGEIDVVDSCGTGGDGAATVNISTAVGLLAAELGLHVAKHGNRSVSSRCGSADVLEACGVKIDAAVVVSQRCLRQERICFLMAPHYHPGVRHAMPVRRALGTRTIFNLIGPLANPAAPRWQLMGVYDPALCVAAAKTLELLGCEAALVVNGGGLDEIGLHGPTRAALLRQGTVRELRIDPGALGLPHRGLDQLAGGDVADNARWLRQLLAGQGPPAHAEVVALNTGALLWVAGRVAELRDGYDLALAELARGRAAERLERWAALSQVDDVDGA